MHDEERPEEMEAEVPEEGEVGSEAEADDAADAVAEAEEEAEQEEQQEADDAEEAAEPKKKPAAKLERLQKILAQSGVASRRKAEEMISDGRVQVNGKVVTELGTKADAGRDHIRVDGKLLQGSERLRYFVLNKPKGFVTTVRDPEGRPTVMQFFEKMRERLYPVGRLDYMSEGLLLVTNDGELANKLTKAASGVEKTYLVKVAGIPTESELDVLRAGVAIEKGKPGTGKVRTSPARIRQVRQGDNPWYEVVLIEGRNRELRKMFEEIGHFVEKIRRVGYGPLILDQEPGKLRELDEQELDLLRKAADGKWKTPKAKEVRRRNLLDSLPPKKPALRARGDKPAAGPKDYKPKKAYGTDKPAYRTDRPSRGPASGPKFSAGERFGGGAAGARSSRPGAAKFSPGRPVEGAPRPAWKKDGPTGRAAGSGFGTRPGGERPGGKPFASKPYGDKPAGGRGFPAKPGWKKPEAGGRPAFKKPFAPRPEATRRAAPEPVDNYEPAKPGGLHIEPVQDFGRSERPRPERARPSAPRPDGPRPERPAFGRTGPGRPGQSRSGAGRPPQGGSARPPAGRSGPARPFRGEGGLARPFTTSSGKPRAGGARPSSKPSYGPGKDAGRPQRASGDDARSERRTGTGWKPKPGFAGKTGAGSGSKGRSSGPKPGGFSKPGFKGKPGGAGGKRSGPKPGGPRPGGKRG